MRRFALALLLLCGVATVAGAETGHSLPRPAALEPAIEFWTRVYTQVDTNAGLIHDRDNMGVVYEAIRLDPTGSRRARIRAVRRSKAHYRDILLELAQGKRSGLDAEQRRVLALWPEDVSDARLRRAAHNIRFQLGQADKFRAGLVRSGAWEPHIRRTLQQMGLPQELAALPHVESSFNPDAWSRVGAAGIWQFTRATGRRYMRIDHVIDERMDPFAASVAAARLLQHNYEITGDWALAITAYNHGLAGVRRAVRAVGSDDIADLVNQHKSRRWGFASRNFYAAFLAAVDVDFHEERYFGDVQRREPLQTETVELPFYASIDTLQTAFEVDRGTLRELNRALRGPIWDGQKRVPRGYELRLPQGPGRPDPQQLLARIDAGERFFAQIPDQFHRVRRGESLSVIARRYDVSMRELMALNNLRNANLIRSGQRLRLPVPEAERALASDGVYTVRRGDTLSGIATRAGVPTSRLAAINGIENANTIQPGQTLRLAGPAPARQPEVAAAPVQDTAAEPAAATAVTVAAAEVDAGAGARSAATETPSATSAAPTAAETPAATTAGSAATETAATTAPTPPEPVVPPGESASEFRDQALMARLQALESRAFNGRDLALAEEIDAGDSVGSAVVEQVSPTLSADPSDYAVAEDNTIEIQAAETLGHYAEWLDLRASRLRRVNDMRYGTPVVIGHRLELDFSRVEPDTFERRRLAYHEDLQARFFEQFRITGTEKVLVRNNDSLWTLARRADNVPVWLLRQYNPDLDFEALHPGIPVTMPTVERQPTSEDGGDAVEVAESRTDT